ncbi:MAG: hypothetical protein WDZ51_17040 [Pirellulaceae bacterium]
MVRTLFSGVMVAGCLTMLAGSVPAAELPGFTTGEVKLQSAGPLAFTPDGFLLVGDPKAAKVLALDVGQEKRGDAQLQIANLNEALAKATGANAANITVVDLKVQPETGAVYLSVNAGGPAIVRIGGPDAVSKVELDKISHASTELVDAPEDKIVGEGRRAGNRRLESITDLAFHEGQVIVTGLSSKDAPSTVRSIAFPFTDSSIATPIEIFHAAHGRDEDYAVVRAFVPFTIGGEPHLLAGFTCTPLVKFPLGALSKSESKVRGTTIAELGNRNRPLDMIVYSQDGKEYVLMSNTARGVMKISTEDIEREEGLTQRVEGGGTAGQQFETITGWDNVVQLAKLSPNTAVVITQADAGSGMQLKSVPLP